MPTKVQIDGVGTVEMDDSFKGKSPAEQQSIVESIASQAKPQSAAQQQGNALPVGDSRNLPAAATVGPDPSTLPRVTRQPTITDQLIASPLGRFAHDVPGNMIRGAATSVANALPFFASLTNPGNIVSGNSSRLLQSGYKPLTDTANNAAEKPYQEALAANRNTPGYAAARANSEKALAVRGGPGFPDSVGGGFLPSVAGFAGGLFGGSLDASNAAADTQSAGQADYASRHPAISGIGNLTGGLMMGTPEMASRVPAYAGDTAAITRLANGPTKAPLPANPATTPVRLPSMNIPPVAPSVAQRATSYVSDLTRTAGMTPADLAQAGTAANGKPLFCAEAIGQPGTVGLAALGRREGITGDALQGAIDERAAAAPDRVLADYASASGVNPAAAAGDMQALVSNGRQAVKPLFDKALSNPAPVWNASLERLAQRPVIRKAMALAADDLRNADRDPLTVGLNPNADGANMLDGNSRSVGTSLQPTAEAWDLVKKNLNGMVERDAFGKLIPDSQHRGNYNIGVANRDLTASLRDAVPGYGEALAKSGDYLSLNKAFDTGQGFILNPNVTAAQVQSHVAGLSEAETQAFKGGIANRLFNQAQNGSLSLKLFNRPAVRQKLEAVLGPQNAMTFLNNVKTEAQLAQSGARMRPGNGSGTAELNSAMASQDGLNPALGMAMDAGQNMLSHGFTMGALKTAGQYLRNPVANLRAGAMPVPVRDAAGSLLMLSPDQLAAHLANYANLPRTRAIQSPTLPANGVRPYGLFGAGFAGQNGNGGNR